MKKLLLTILCSVYLLFFIGLFSLQNVYTDKYRKVIEKYYPDWKMVSSIILAESSFDPNAKSKAGAVGLMQILPSTATFLQGEECDLYNEEINICIGCKYLKYLQNKYSCFNTVLAAYNAGEGRVDGWLKSKNYSKDGKTLQEIPFLETKNYLKKIEKYYHIYTTIYLTNLTLMAYNNKA